jgi:hypothetical protein
MHSDFNLERTRKKFPPPGILSSHDEEEEMSGPT